MTSAARPLPEWTTGYAKLRDRIASFPGPGVIRSVSEEGEDVELLRYWPQEPWDVGNDVNRLMLLGRTEEQTAKALAGQGWELNATLVLLAARPTDVEQVVKLADTSALFEAPMDDYDVVEVTDFDRPVARGRMHYGQNYALLSDPDLYSPQDPDTARRAVLANFAGAAFQHGLPWILLVASEENSRQLAEGWSRATPISVMIRAQG